MTPFEQLMTALEDDDNDESGLTDTQIVARLRDSFEKLAAPVELFKPGQIVRYRLGANATVRDGGAPSIFMRYLPEAVNMIDLAKFEHMGQTQATMIFDCVVGYWKDRDTFCGHFATATELESHPDFRDDDQ